MSTVILGLVAVIVTVFGAVGGQRLVARRVPIDAREPINEVGGVFFGLIGGTFGVLLAFAIATVWTQFDSTKQIVEREANLVADIYRISRVFQTAEGTDLRKSARDYAKIVVQHEWADMASYRENANANGKMHDIWAAAQKIDPKGSREEAVYAILLTQISQANDQRRLRLLAARDSIHSGIWAVLILNGVVTIAVAAFFGLRGKYAHARMVAALASVIAAGLFLVAALDHPFTGGLAIQPDAFNTALSSMDHTDQM